MIIILQFTMPKNDKKAVASSEKSSKKNRFDKNKERAYIARTGYKNESISTEKSQVYKCPVSGRSFVHKGAYEIHRKSYGAKTNVSCTTQDFTNPDYLPIEEITGARYREANKRKPEWVPRFELQKYLTVVVDEETGKTEKKWLTVKKYRDFRSLMDDDGETVIDETGEQLEYIDDEVNFEGDDQPIIEE
jgi:hypothetical protein